MKAFHFTQTAKARLAASLGSGASRKPSKKNLQKSQNNSCIHVAIGYIARMTTTATHPTIIEIRTLQGTDGNYYRPLGFPRGVKSTGVTKLVGYAFQGGFSLFAASQEELVEKWNRWQSEK